jgi:hypothetical protein
MEIMYADMQMQNRGPILKEMHRNYALANSAHCFSALALHFNHRVGGGLHAWDGGVLGGRQSELTSWEGVRD